jgi:hypothetical protein
MPVRSAYNVNTGDGSTDFGLNNRLALTLGDGSTILLFSEYTTGGVMKFKLMKLTGEDLATQTLLTTFDPPSSDAKGGFTAAVFPNDSIAVLVKSEDKQSLRYCRINSPGWDAQAWETVHTHSGEFTAGSMDIDVSGNAAVFVCWNQNGPTDVHSRLKVRDTGGTWNSVRDEEISDGPARLSCDAASITCLGIGGTATERNVAFAHGVGKAGLDQGVLLYTIGINEDTGAITDAASLRATYMAAEADSANTTTATQRNVKLFRCGTTDDFILAMLHRAVGKRIGVVKATYNNNVWSVVNQLDTSVIGFTPVGNNTAISCRHNDETATESTVNFYARNKISDTEETLGNVIAKIDSDGITFSGGLKYGVPSKAKFTTYAVRYLASGGNKNLELARHQVIMELRGKLSSGGSSSTVEWVYVGWGDTQPVDTTAIISTKPVNGGVADSSNPDLEVVIDDDQRFAQSRQKVQWQFATVSSFASGTIAVSYTQPDSKFVKIEGTNTTGKTVTITDKLPSNYALTGGTYYMRARMVDEWGNLGKWTTTRTVFLIHPPVTTAKSPANGVFLHYGDGEVTFDWTVTDSSPTDHQTAYQLQVITNAGVTILSTSKITSEETTHAATISDTYKNTLLYWIVKAWDTNDTPGNFSEPAFFTLTDPPSATIIEPDPDEIVETGMPDLIANMVTSGGRKIKQVVFAITKGKQPVWNTKRLGNWSNGEDVTVQVPQDVLSNNTKYSVQVSVVDSGNLSGVSAVHAFTVAWTPPPAPTTLTGDYTTYYPYELVLDEPAGYNLLEWTDVADSDFYSWNLYRKDDLIDPNTNDVLEYGEYKLIYREYETGSAYEFRDYFAPAGAYRSRYVLRQQIDLNGQMIESDNGNIVTTYQKSDGYWLILESTIPGIADVFKFNVNEDSFTDEQEESEFTVVGRGRVVNRGEDLGPKGTMTSKIRDSAGRTARQKRLLLLDAQKTLRKVWLRNPFGDVFRVSVSQIQVSRIPGVGLQEFVDVSIPYAKVGK